ncbi:MAG: hypothetical protein EOO61_10010 [Hymenobacter sp.]|nr:MAG: hypothetical protein EOO61_10010 [Hymenobacter sp.]
MSKAGLVARYTSCYLLMVGLLTSSLLPNFKDGYVTSPDAATPFAAVSASAAPALPASGALRGSPGWRGLSDPLGNAS